MKTNRRVFINSFKMKHSDTKIDASNFANTIEVGYMKATKYKELFITFM